MLQIRNRQVLSWGFLVFSLGRIGMAAPAADCEGTIAADLRLVQQHPWRPPFGLERIGQLTIVAADLPVRERPYREFWLASFAAGKEVERQMLTLNASANKTSFTGQASFSPYPEEVALFGRCRFQGEPVEIARKKFEMPGLSAEAAVKPEPVINPVFELLKAPPKLTAVHLVDRLLLPAEYAWDGRVLWVKATLSDTTVMRVEFGTARK